MKQFVADNLQIEGRVIDNTAPEFMELAGKYGVSVAPTLLVFSDEGEQVLRANEVGEIEYWISTQES